MKKFLLLLLPCLLVATLVAWTLAPRNKLSEQAAFASPSVSATPEATVQPTPAPPTAQEMLERSWASYRRNFIQQDGRTIDPFRDQATTSEGQSYSLLRAVWMNDQATFDTVLNWTNNNLRIRGDQLFGYLWGAQPDGGWGIIDRAVATDADQDIALALIIASQRWGDQRYLDQSRAILHDLWPATVITIGDRPYITAGDWARDQKVPTLNPSYLAPYAYRIFATIDHEQPWASLVDTSYQVIEGCTYGALDRPVSASLPPNWCGIERTSGRFVPAQSPTQPLDSDFGYDAFRTYWRVALDARYNQEPRAIAYLQRSNALQLIWQQHGAVSSIYHHDGSIAREQEDATVYGGLIAQLAITNPSQADQLFATNIAPLFTEQDGQAYWSEPRNYYRQNWLWFGLALYCGNTTLPQN